MNNFTALYRILSYLETAMDDDEINLDRLSAESIGVSENRAVGLIMMLVEEDYVEGIKVSQAAEGSFEVAFIAPHITLKGLEYLSESPQMLKAAIGEMKKNG